MHLPPCPFSVSYVSMWHLLHLVMIIIMCPLPLLCHSNNELLEGITCLHHLVPKCLVQSLAHHRPSRYAF